MKPTCSSPRHPPSILVSAYFGFVRASTCHSFVDHFDPVGFGAVAGGHCGWTSKKERVPKHDLPANHLSLLVRRHGQKFRGSILYPAVVSPTLSHFGIFVTTFSPFLLRGAIRAAYDPGTGPFVRRPGGPNHPQVLPCCHVVANGRRKRLGCSHTHLVLQLPTRLFLHTRTMSYRSHNVAASRDVKKSREDRPHPNPPYSWGLHHRSHFCPRVNMDHRNDISHDPNLHVATRHRVGSGREYLCRKRKSLEMMLRRSYNFRSGEGDHGIGYMLQSGGLLVVCSYIYHHLGPCSVWSVCDAC